MRAKKGLVFHIAMVLVTLIVMTQAYLVIEAKRDKVEQTLGEQQFNIYSTLQDIESGDRMLEYEAQDAARRAVLDQAETGGQYFESCGSSAGFTYWKKGEKDCYPMEMDNFRKHFNRFIYHPDYDDIQVNLVDKGSYTEIEGSSENTYKISIGSRNLIEER